MSHGIVDLVRPNDCYSVNFLRAVRTQRQLAASVDPSCCTDSSISTPPTPILGDPAHEAYSEMVDWVGDDLCPAPVDLVVANRRLSSVTF